MTLNKLYHHNLGLLTDLYQLTMAYGYWKHRRQEEQAVFNLFFRKHPFGGGYTIAAGLQTAVEYLDGFHFDAEDIDYLGTLDGNDGKALFEQGFLDFLAELEFACDVDAIPEGTVVFPHEPLLRIRGPLIQAQLLETALLNIINFQTLIATKAARICHAAQGDAVLEFGLRRAQGIDGALSASRAAYLGGCHATSNVLAGKLYGILVKGTHAHSWVMSHDDELESFERYAEAMPNNCVFLVDTYDTQEGVKKAVEVGLKLRERGHEIVGIRLDSGDLAYLSIEARKLLDAAGFPEALIVASNDLTEHLIQSLKQQGAKIAVWGVGTKLATAYDQPALGGVYKLSAIAKQGEDWRYCVKLSEQLIKVSNPGIQNIRRFTRNGTFVADAIYNEALPPEDAWRLVPFENHFKTVDLPETLDHEDLLKPVFRAGKQVEDLPTLEQSREHAQKQLGAISGGCLRLENPHSYNVGLEKNLYELKKDLIQDVKQ